MRRNYRYFALAFSFAFIVCSGFGQANFVENNPDQTFKLAKELFAKEEFSLAYPLLKAEQLSNAKNKFSIAETELSYYIIVCELKLQGETAVGAAKNFIAHTTNEARKQMMAFHLGSWYFSTNDYNAALQYYEIAGPANLTNRQIADMKFNQGYAYFSLQRFKEARVLFDVIRQMPNDPHYIDANYYYGFIQFYDKQYNAALKSFTLIENEPSYVRVVPYYVSQIYYFNGEKDKAISYSKAALEKGNQYYALQLKQLIGHAYFEKKDYNSALPYLEEYVRNASSVRREDMYELSYCYYQAGRFDDAVKGFKELGGKEDSLAQNSMYLLADAYLKTGQKQNARSAFLFCAQNSANLQQKEISQFNYGKLSFDLGFNDIALQELQAFVVNYPNSSYVPEAKDILVQVLATGNNYKDALSLFRTLTQKSEGVKKLLPKIIFGRAVDFVNDQKLDEGDALLNEFFGLSYNQPYISVANFWKGEIMFRQGKYDSAVYFLNRYIQSPAIHEEANPLYAQYNLGYSYLRLENYSAALNAFSKAAPQINVESSPVQQDAYLRRGDALFMLKTYDKALVIYNYFIDNNLPGADYALFQKALIAGAQGRPKDKILLLASLNRNYPSSAYYNDALMEAGNTHMALEDYSEAIAVYNRIVQQKPASPNKPIALLNTGVAYFNLEDNKNAVQTFKTIVAEYPNSDESMAAVDYIKNIFIEQQQPDAFISFMKQNNIPLSYSEEDSLTFVAADLRYAQNDVSNATKGFINYLSKFPDGRYFIEASFKAAHLLNMQKEYAKALPFYARVVEFAPNNYSVQSALQAARINYFELQKYEEAEKYFSLLKAMANDASVRLEAMRGLLRSQYKLKKFGAAVSNAKDLLNEKGLATDDKMMAGLVIAKNYQFNNQLVEAQQAYQDVFNLGKSEFSAEARYRYAEVLFAQQKLDAAEKAAFETIKKAGSYDYWITKSYILLGEIYYNQHDYFNAEATLKSVVENARLQELKQEAQTKLDIILTEKNKNTKVQQ